MNKVSLEWQVRLVLVNNIFLGTAIDTVRKEEPNPFDKATKFTSYSFTGHYEGSLSRPINIHNNHNIFSTYNNNDDSDVEIFK